MSTWEELMSQWAVERHAEQIEHEQGPWRRFCAERGGMSAGVYEGVFSHYHFASHGNGSYDAATRQFDGGVSAMIYPDGWQGPSGDENCPICRDYPQFVAGIDPETTP